MWHGMESATPESYTASDTFDWAFCTPVLGKACRGWGLYVAGRFNVERSGLTPSSDPTDLREDVKFTELVAAMLSSLRQMRLLEHRHATLSQFFSPVVLDTLADEDPEVVLSPRETEVSVLFCDLRGFSRESERQAGDLLGLLQRVSNALGVMTRHIREQGGVVGDFQGDAAMGFWGWPLPQDDAVPRTCRAALAMRAEFAGHRLSGGHRRGHRPGGRRKDRHRRSGESDRFRAGRESRLAAGRHDQDAPRPDLVGRGHRADRPPTGAARGRPRAAAGDRSALRARRRRWK